MSSAPVNRNPNKLTPGANMNRPSGCSELATDRDPRALLSALMYGNRSTRREAARNARKLLKKGSAKA
jgi:hypothetical protein